LTNMIGEAIQHYSGREGLGNLKFFRRFYSLDCMRIIPPLSIDKGHTQIASLLIAAGAKFKYKTINKKANALELATSKHRQDIVELLEEASSKK
jgi:hypothetical protein